MIPEIHSPIAKSAINLELSKSIIDEVLDIFKEASSGVSSPYMYYYYLDSGKTLLNSFEEKSSSQLACLHSNLGIHSSCVLLFLLCIVHNEYYEFFTSITEEAVHLIKWIEKFVENDQKRGDKWIKTIATDSLLSPGVLKRRGKLITPTKNQVEIYTLENFWEIRHSRDYK